MMNMHFKYFIWILWIGTMMGYYQLDGVKPIASALQQGFLLRAFMIIGMMLQESENAIEVSKVCKPKTHELLLRLFVPNIG